MPDPEFHQPASSPDSLFFTRPAISTRSVISSEDVGRAERPCVHSASLRAPRSIYNVGVDFSIRDFRSNDFEILWHIDQQCFAPGISYSQPELAAYMHLLGSFTLIAESSNSTEPRILGFLVATVHRPRQGHVITIDVLPDARRSGMGSKLLSAAEQRLRAAHCTTVRLETAVNNLAALAFYKHHAYFVVKTLPRYYPDGLDAFVLEKNLLSTPPGK